MVIVVPLEWVSHILSSMLKVGLIYKVIFEQRLKEEEKDFQVTERRAFPVIRNRLGKIYKAEICLPYMYENQHEGIVAKQFEERENDVMTDESDKQGPDHIQIRLL